MAQHLKVTNFAVWDRKVRHLAGKGMATDIIANQTGLTPGQVHYRLKVWGVRISNYRTGKSKEGFKVLSVANNTIGTAKELANRIGDLAYTRRVARRYQRELDRSTKALARAKA